MKKVFFWLVLVFAIALTVRFFRLATFPMSLSMDEVGFGYNAYSVLATGKDEYGQKLPLAFRNLGDYKLPVNVYLTSFSVAVFGLNEFAIRFPVALTGALTPVLFILLLRKLKFSWKSSLMSGFWMSILGWHIFLSRASFETVTALFFVLLGTLFYLIWAESRKPAHFLFCVLFFGISVWTYNAARLFVPLLFTSFLFIFKGSIGEIARNPKKYIPSFVVLLLFVIPLVYLFLTGASVVSRAQDLWIGKDNSPWIVQYLNYFDPVFWFWKGLKLTPPGYPDVGLLYLIDIPVFLSGFYALSISKNKILKRLVLMWMFLAPIPASFTRGDASPVRFLIFLPFFGFIMASGFEKLFTYSRKVLYLGLYLALLLFNFAYFLDLYFNNFYKFYGDLWHYGYKEVSKYACQNYQKYDKIIITDKYGIEWPSTKTVPYLYVLVHCGWDPQGYLNDKSLYNIEFRQPQWRIDSRERNYLLIGSRWDFPEDFDMERIIKIIYFPESTHEPKAAFYFVETKK